MSLRAIPLAWALGAIAAGAGEVVMTQIFECQPIEFSESGTLRASVGGRERVLVLRGVVVPAEAVAGVNRLLQRLGRQQLPARCSAAPAAWPPTNVPAPVTIEYVAWRDKSGEVWEDLAGTLLDEGLARAAPGGAADGEAYRAREREAQAAGRGLWSHARDALR